jgi:predicted branched-subunit amino acid permease
MSSDASSERPAPSPAAVFRNGLIASFRSVFALVLIGTYVGIGALAHDYGFSLVWILVSTVVMWAGPAQVIMVSALGTGATLVEVALAVFLSAVRFLPMVVRDLLIPAHFTAASMWVESFRLLPPLPRDQRLPFCNGLAIGFMLSGHIGSVIGYFLAASLPPILTAALLFLTPMSFLVSTAREAGSFANQLALALGLVVSPILAYYQVGLDLMWTGLIAGTAAYGIHRLRGALQ